MDDVCVMIQPTKTVLKPMDRPHRAIKNEEVGKQREGRDGKGKGLDTLGDKPMRFVLRERQWEKNNNEHVPNNGGNSLRTEKSRAPIVDVFVFGFIFRFA